jgi:hypothetical protein
LYAREHPIAESGIHPFIDPFTLALTLEDRSLAPADINLAEESFSVAAREVNRIRSISGFWGL